MNMMEQREGNFEYQGHTARSVLRVGSEWNAQLTLYIVSTNTTTTTTTTIRSGSYP